MDRRYVRVLIVSFISYNLKNFSEGNDSEETRVSMFFNFLKEDRTHGGGCYIALWFLQINLYFFFFFFFVENIKLCNLVIFDLTHLILEC